MAECRFAEAALATVSLDDIITTEGGTCGPWWAT